MDIHRCRFVPYPPSTINVLAFSHPYIGDASEKSTLRLAIGRANGDIEIWNPLSGSWLQETIFRGGKDRSVDGLVWTKDPDEKSAEGSIIPGKLRLFSIGYTTTVTEWNLETGQPLRQTSGNHSEIWCLAAQPRIPTSEQTSVGQWTGQNIVTGCIDGTVVLYSTEGEDLRLKRILARSSAKKAKIISITFQDRNIVVAGCTDSKIRVYDTRNGTLIKDLSLGASSTGAPKETIVWTIKCLPNGNIVSGDSSGELKIWDGQTYTLIQRVRSHRQDVLSIATSLDGSTIFSGGMDRRTVVYKQIGKQKTRWAEITHKRFHSHDVKAMTSFEGDGMSVVVSGGPDSHPVIAPLREFGLENHRTLPSLPQDPAVQSASGKRIMISWWDREVHLWRMLKPTKSPAERDDSESEAEDRTTSRKLLAKIVIKGEASITSASLTPDGSLLAVSTTSETKVFQLRLQDFDGDLSLTVSKFDLSKSLSLQGCRRLLFSQDKRWIVIVDMNNEIFVARIVGATDDSGESLKVLSKLSNLKRLDRKQERRFLLGGLGAYDRGISRLAFSADSRILAASDLAGYIDTWVLEGLEDLTQSSGNDPSQYDVPQVADEDESDIGEDDHKSLIFGQQWIRNPSASLLPKLPASPVVMSFRPVTTTGKTQPNGAFLPHATRGNPTPHSHDLPDGEDRLLVVTAASQVYEFEVLRGALSAWSRKNSTSKFPDSFKNLLDQPMGCVWDVQAMRQRLWLYGSKWLWMFDMSQDFPLHAEQNGGLQSRESDTKKRKARNGRDSSPEGLRKGQSGAGGKIPDDRLGTGISRKMRRFSHGEDPGKELLNLDTRRTERSTHDKDDEDGDDNEESTQAPMSALDRLRHAAAATLQNGHAQKGYVNGRADECVHWWHTYKYRPIMGIVPLGNASSTDRGDAVEVALVERPQWDLDLPHRYYGDQEWEKPGL